MANLLQYAPILYFYFRNINKIRFALKKKLASLIFYVKTHQLHSMKTIRINIIFHKYSSFYTVCVCAKMNNSHNYSILVVYYILSWKCGSVKIKK